MIPGWIANVMFLVTCYVAGYQHVQFNRVNPVMNVQFFTMAFSLVMVVIVALYDKTDPWLSLVFLLIAVGCLGLTIRQHRLIPPRKPFE